MHVPQNARPAGSFSVYCILVHEQTSRHCKLYAALAGLCGARAHAAEAAQPVHLCVTLQVLNTVSSVLADRDGAGAHAARRSITLRPINPYVSLLSGHGLEDRACLLLQDVVAPGRMRRKIHNPRILLLDCPLEYKKGENQTNVELSKEEDWCEYLCEVFLSKPHVL